MATVRWMDWESNLVCRAQKGDLTAFEKLADLYRDALRAQALRSLRNLEDANDAVQETVVKAYRAINNFEPGRPVLPWLARICSNCCIDIIRQRKHQTETIDKVEYGLASDQDLDAEAAASFDGERIRASVNKLPKKYREIVVMRHFQEMEVSEIAKSLNRPEGTVKSWLFRARALLRKELEPVHRPAY